jgi:hypothetical protein
MTVKQAVLELLNSKIQEMERRIANRNFSPDFIKERDRIMKEGFIKLCEKKGWPVLADEEIEAAMKQTKSKSSRLEELYKKRKDALVVIFKIIEEHLSDDEFKGIELEDMDFKIPDPGDPTNPDNLMIEK